MSRSRPSLAQLLKRAHLQTILVAVLLAGLTLTATGLFTMRALAEHNLRLVARALSYTVEAAVVFSDPEAASSSLQMIASREALDSARIFDRHNRLLASWDNPDRKAKSWQYSLANLLKPKPVQITIRHGNNRVGQLELTGNGKLAGQFLLKGLLMVVLSLGLALAVSLYLTSRLSRRISKPLAQLAQVTHRVRTERNFKARVPRARIAELNLLGEDFNALLSELQAWQRLQEQEKAELNHQASHDSLTGLANRALFEATLARAQLNALKEHSRFALLYVDADHFKQVNDQLGHAAGDQVLQQLAQRLRQQVRSADTVARLGGDEFAILLSGLSDGQAADRIAENIMHSMQEPMQLDDGRQHIQSLSIGLAVFPDDAQDVKDLLLAADQAMYSSKHAGRGLWRRSQHQPTLDQEDSNAPL